MPKVEVYTRPFCPYCVRARRLLTARGVEFREFDVWADKEAGQRMRALSNRTSVPQIFIDDYHVGGSDDLAEADASGALARLVGQVP